MHRYSPTLFQLEDAPHQNPGMTLLELAREPRQCRGETPAAFRATSWRPPAPLSSLPLQFSMGCYPGDSSWVEGSPLSRGRPTTNLEGERNCPPTSWRWCQTTLSNCRQDPPVAAQASDRHEATVSDTESRTGTPRLDASARDLTPNLRLVHMMTMASGECAATDLTMLSIFDSCTSAKAVLTVRSRRRASTTSIPA